MIRGDDHRLRPAGDSPQLGSRGSVGLDAELRVKLLHPLIDEDLWADDEDLGDSIPLHELADDQAGADRLSEPHVVGEECHGEPPAEPHQVLHLVAVWLDTILPVPPRFNVLGRLDDDRLSERPFQRSAVEAEIIRMLCRRQFAGDDLGLHGEWLRLVDSWKCMLRAASISGHPGRWLATINGKVVEKVDHAIKRGRFTVHREAGV